jgi:hypothetical protein
MSLNGVEKLKFESWGAVNWKKLFRWPQNDISSKLFSSRLHGLDTNFELI